MIKRAVFLDRDGTINEDIGDLYTVEKLKFISDALESMAILQKKFLLFIITNQAGIGKRNFTEEDFLKFNKEYFNILGKEGLKIEEVYYCPHTEEDDCVCRKPKTYFVEKAIKKYKLNMRESFVVGDHPCDVEMSYRAQMTSIFLLTGHGKKHLQEIQGNTEFLISKNIYDATLLIQSLSDKF
ncbi:MAG: HAD family hydrolase [Actinobacteria bacterium]|nr:HAD family hydrolase [Actinomycetota bacterium]MBL7061016.1 HAD family hydrolase [Actinomycetota bacterium]